MRLMRRTALPVLNATALLLGAVFAQPLSAAEIYRWVDENGIVNYTQQKPHGVAAELVGSSTRRPPPQVTGTTAVATASPAAVPGLTSEAAEEPELTDKQQQILDDLKQAEADRLAALAEARVANCEKARQVLTNLTKIGRVRVVGADGTQTVLPEEDRQRRINEAQQAIAMNCAG